MMKPAIFLAAALMLLALTTGSAPASVSIDLQAGDLRTANGAAPLASGSLLLLVASGPGGTFSNNLVQGQYVAGADTILAAFSSNNALGGNSATANNLTNLTVTGLTGDSLELVWFPTLTFSSYNPSSPNTLAGQSYGVYAGPTSGSPNGGNPWIVPADGTSDDALNFVTTSLNSSLGAGLTDAVPNSDGYANLQVGASSVPEPKTIPLLVFALPLLAWAVRRQGRARILRT